MLNVIVDYFLLLAAKRIIRASVPLFRIIGGSLAGGISSLYIFAPQAGIITELVYKTSVCALTVLLVFGFGGLKKFIRNCGIFLLVTCGYGGIMIAVWYVFKPSGMLVNNSVVYFNISPIILIASSVVAYILFMIFSSVFARTSGFAEKCNITVSADNSCIEITGIVDTGNSLEDVLGNSEVIIVDKKCIKLLFGNSDIASNEGLKLRYRLMPCGTVSGSGLLEGYRCDNAVIDDGKKSVRLEKPILAVSKVNLRDDYSAIVNPKIFIR